MTDEQRQLAETESQALEQMALVLGDERPFIDRSEQTRHITAERFQHWYPKRYEAACKLLASEQFTDKDIGGFLCADWRTIREVRLTRISDVTKQRALLTPKLFAGTMMLQERVMELVPDCGDIQKVSVAMGIHKDAYLAVSGMPTIKIDVNHHVDVFGGLRELIQQAEEKMAQAQVVEPITVEDASANE